MSGEMELKPGDPKYDFEEVNRGLLKLIEWRGNVNRAERDLELPTGTLRRWREAYPDRYEELERKYGEELEAELVAEARENARLAGRGVREGVLRVTDQITNGMERACPRCYGAGVIERDDEEQSCPRCKATGVIFEPMVGRELAQSTFALAKIMGTNVDKVLALTGRPVSGRENSSEDVVGLIRELQAAGVVKVVNQADAEGTAEDEDRPAGSENG